MYDSFSIDYDRFVDWDARLAAEMPFLEVLLDSADAHRVLDTACGTGMHAIALAERGYQVVGADSSEGMIERARANATRFGRNLSADCDGNVCFVTAGFGDLAEAMGIGPHRAQIGQPDTRRFDALLCLGNSLPHVLTPAALAATLDDFVHCLRPGGLLLIQNRNFDGVLPNTDRWMGPQSHREGAKEWLFLRFYDFDPDGLITFNIVRLTREGDRDWTQDVSATRLWPLTERDLTPALEKAGFTDLTTYGDMQESPFDPCTSPNLVIAAYTSTAESCHVSDRAHPRPSPAPLAPNLTEEQ